MLTVVIKLHSIRVHIELHYYYYSRLTLVITDS